MEKAKLATSLTLAVAKKLAVPALAALGGYVVAAYPAYHYAFCNVVG